MPNVTNVVLNLQHGGGIDPNSTRTVNVSFTTRFTAAEVLARAVFRAVVTLRSDDFDKTIHIGSRLIQATNQTIATQMPPSDVKRQDLDEDVDLSGFPPRLQEKPDEWFATVNISPVVFGSDTANSDIVVGSWGILGSSIDN